MLLKQFVSVCVTHFVVALMAAPIYAQVHSGDVVLKVIDDAIVTGVAADGFTPSRVFSAELGEIIPNEVDEPGFDNEVGTFPADSAIHFRILDSLRKWDGTDFDGIATETMEIRFGTSLGPIATPTMPSSVDGFALNVAADGSWHRHLDFLLTSPATDGIYLLNLMLENSHEELESSQPFFIVFNQNETEAAHNAAIAYAETLLVPEPHANAFVGFGGVALCVLASRVRKRSKAKQSEASNTCDGCSFIRKVLMAHSVRGI